MKLAGSILTPLEFTAEVRLIIDSGDFAAIVGNTGAQVIAHDLDDDGTIDRYDVRVYGDGMYNSATVTMPGGVTVTVTSNPTPVNNQQQH